MEGEVLHEENLGPQVAGLVGFQWKDLPKDMIESKKANNDQSFYW